MVTIYWFLLDVVFKGPIRSIEIKPIGISDFFRWRKTYFCIYKFINWHCRQWLTNCCMDLFMASNDIVPRNWYIWVVPLCPRLVWLSCNTYFWRGLDTTKAVKLFSWALVYLCHIPWKSKLKRLLIVLLLFLTPLIILEWVEFSCCNLFISSWLNLMSTLCIWFTEVSNPSCLVKMGGYFIKMKCLNFFSPSSGSNTS